MQVIQTADDKITKVWGKGKIQPTTYRLFTYVFTANVDGGTLLHNGATGEMIFLDEKEMRNISALPCVYASWMDELIEKHFIVKAELDDKKSVDTLRMALRTIGTTKNITGYTILPTTCCNARCFYCYEHGIAHKTMNDTTADSLLEFMKAHRGSEILRISWFGGEPLMGKPQIDRICKALKKENIPFQSSMISNGYLFNREIAEHACLDWNLKSIQITLDGTEKVYNEVKAYISPYENPFKKVLENIGFLLANGIRVRIRLNLGPHNIDDLNELVSQLVERFEDKTNLSVYSHVLFDDCGTKPMHFESEELTHLLEEQNALNERIMQYAPPEFKKKLPKLKVNRCMADNPSSIVVTPSGMLGKCEHYAEEHYVGSIQDGITDKKEVALFEEHEVFTECFQCPMYPSCIKLKLCTPDRRYIEVECKFIIKEVIRSMRSHFESFSRGDKRPSEVEDAWDC